MTFWKTESERLAYEYAAETTKRREGEGPITYVQRIAEAAQNGGRPADKEEEEQWWQR